MIDALHTLAITGLWAYIALAFAMNTHRVLSDRRRQQ